MCGVCSDASCFLFPVWTFSCCFVLCSISSGASYEQSSLLFSCKSRDSSLSCVTGGRGVTVKGSCPQIIVPRLSSVTVHLLPFSCFTLPSSIINQQKKKMFSSVLIVSVCLLTCLLSCVSSAGEEMKVKPGENVTLPCRGPRDAVIKLIMWNRPDLKSEDYVFFYREKLLDEFQHPSYRGRVELTDPQVKDGDVSVILKNVTINDAGRYECHVGKKGSRPQLINTITLKVVDSGITEERGDKEGGDKEGGDKEGNSSGNVGLRVGLSVAALLGVVGVVGFMINRTFRRLRAAAVI